MVRRQDDGKLPTKNDISFSLNDSRLGPQHHPPGQGCEHEGDEVRHQGPEDHLIHSQGAEPVRLRPRLQGVLSQRSASTLPSSPFTNQTHSDPPLQITRQSLSFRDTLPKREQWISTRTRRPRNPSPSSPTPCPSSRPTLASWFWSSLLTRRTLRL